MWVSTERSYRLIQTPFKSAKNLAEGGGVSLALPLDPPLLWVISESLVPCLVVRLRNFIRTHFSGGRDTVSSVILYAQNPPQSTQQNLCSNKEMKNQTESFCNISDSAFSLTKAKFTNY